MVDKDNIHIKFIEEKKGKLPYMKKSELLEYANNLELRIKILVDLYDELKNKCKNCEGYI